ncbi:hypothetical protein ACFY00_25600 [Kitasatospora sp. NPDC001540]
MASPTPAVHGTPPAPRPAALRRVVAASLIGTTIEWYDDPLAKCSDLRVC